MVMDDVNALERAVVTGQMAVERAQAALEAARTQRAAAMRVARSAGVSVARLGALTGNRKRPAVMADLGRVW